MSKGFVHGLFEYLKIFMNNSEENWIEIRNQARSIFTTICIVGKIEADTYKCDVMLRELFQITGLEEIMDYDDFEEFMIEYIV